MNDQFESNKVFVKGVVNDKLELSHEVYGEKFYIFTIKIPRLSSICDYIKVLISERLLINCNIKQADQVKIEGQFRSYNNYSSEGNRLILTVFARKINFCSQEDDQLNPNVIFLDGYMCKKPIYRTTPFGREICDLLIAVNRAYSKSDYIPAIAWGKNARFCRDIKVGENIRLWGRIQSREYQKKLNEIDTVTKVAYEISINKLQVAPFDESQEQSNNA